MRDTLVITDKEFYSLGEYNIHKGKFNTSPQGILGQRLRDAGCDFSKTIQITTKEFTGETIINFSLLPHYDNSDMD